MEHLQLFVSKLVIDARDGEPESHHCHRRQKILFETKRDHNSSNRSLRHVLDQFGNLPTYPSPQSTLTLASYLGKNVGLGEGLVDSFQKPKLIQVRTRPHEFGYFF